MQGFPIFPNPTMGPVLKKEITTSTPLNKLKPMRAG
jgi:hypothetical protein